MPENRAFARGGMTKNVEKQKSGKRIAECVCYTIRQGKGVAKGSVSYAAHVQDKG